MMCNMYFYRAVALAAVAGPQLEPIAEKGETWSCCLVGSISPAVLFAKAAHIYIYIFVV